MKIIHISDIHMCPEGMRVVGFDPAIRLKKVVDAVNEEHSDADLCIISGDLTDLGDGASYQRLKTIIETLTVPVRLMLGNHDNRAAFRRIFPDAADDGHGFVQDTIHLGALRVILLDTLDEAQPSNGYLCETRLAWLERQLATDRTSATVIFLHHPPLSLGVEYFEAMLLRNGVELERRLAPYANVRHLAFGHVHFPTFGLWGGRSFSASRGTCHPIHPTLEGLRARYVDRPPGYEILLFDEDRVVVHPMQTVDHTQIVAQEDADGVGGAGSIEVFRHVAS